MGTRRLAHKKGRDTVARRSSRTGKTVIQMTSGFEGLSVIWTAFVVQSNCLSNTHRYRHLLGTSNIYWAWIVSTSHTSSHSILTITLRGKY